MKQRGLLNLLVVILVIMSLGVLVEGCKRAGKKKTSEAEVVTPGVHEAEGEEGEGMEEGPSEMFREEAGLKAIYFAFDSSDLTASARKILKSNAEFMGQMSGETVVVEGHCDERGTNEYNMALGDRRAKAARDYLVSLGISSARLNTISYGEERPAALGHDEDSWAQNRRAEFKVQ